ncbi:MAG: hypothetical protein M0038_05630 [Pseudomonadota bacterium]|jgi:hypothetical protein|nr:hypothetical protein [Pseudomonadota bacterium]
MTLAEAEAWAAEHGPAPGAPDDGICFAELNGEFMGPFACAAEASRALDRKLADTPPVHGMYCGRVMFVDPTIYHLPEGTVNG